MTSPSTHRAPIVLQAKQLELSFGHAKSVVHNFSLEVVRGEVVTLIGASGAGKSTVLRTLAGLNQATAGQVLVGDCVLSEPNPCVAMAFQYPGLLPWLNVAENVAFGLGFKSQASLSATARDQRVQSAIAQVGLSHASALYPDQISGGMAQRVALARCLARQPQVLLLDEPFGALDEVTRQHMQCLLLQARDRHQMGVVLVTHDIDEALLVSDRIVLLAGAPATTRNEWSLSGSTRDLLSDDLVKLRVDILKTLRQSMVATTRTNPDQASDKSHSHSPKEYAHVL